MIRRALTAVLLAATVAGFAPARALPVSTPVRCVAHDFAPSCGYESEGQTRLWSLRFGPWVARVFRSNQLIWTVGGSFATTMAVPAEAGDRVQIVLLTPSHCEIPGTGTPQPACDGAGPVMLVEGGPEIPYLP